MSWYLIVGEMLIFIINNVGKYFCFNEFGVVEVDFDFICMFIFQFLEGDLQQVLDELNSIVLLVLIVKKYFNEVSFLG